MIRICLATAVLCLGFGSTQAQNIYKCTVNGKSVIQDAICPPKAASAAVRVTYMPSTAADKARAEANLHRLRVTRAQEEAVASGRIMLGMSAEQVLAAWGAPKKINRTIVRGRISEQAIYANGQYVYFENGIVTALQDSITP